ncbi:MAG: hypothetical protein N4A46_16025 [Schleiferiaceae bacterium]|jgi:hypothetical protein|nr:hypothetical protein [Schleiferiaceae bacterium]
MKKWSKLSFYEGLVFWILIIFLVPKLDVVFKRYSSEADTLSFLGLVLITIISGVLGVVFFLLSLHEETSWEKKLGAIFNILSGLVLLFYFFFFTMN